MRDPDLDLLASISATLMPDYVDPASDPWEGSPFAWIKTCPSRQRGKIAEQLIAGWCGKRGLSVSASGDSDADRVIQGKRVEIKSSTMWQSGIYKFQQIRDQRYDYALLLGLSPFAIHCWVVPKAVLLERPHKSGISAQHGGRQGRDTLWLSFRPDAPPVWLADYGGSLSRAYDLLLAMS